MTCPKCGSHKLTYKTMFYDLLVSSMIDCYEYLCKDCGFKFEVKETQ